MTKASIGRVGGLVRSPVFLVALAVLFVNDQVLKARFGGPITGKLSDVAGLIVVPIVVVTVTEIVRGRTCDVSTMVRCSVGVAAVFALVQLWAPAGAAYEDVFGVARWPVDSLVALLGGGLPSAPGRVALFADPTDLLALPAAVIPVWIARRHRRRRPSHGTSTSVGAAATG